MRDASVQGRPGGYPFEKAPLPHAPGPALRNSPLRGSDSPRLFPVRARGSRRSKGFERLSPSPAFRLQLNVQNDFLRVQLNVYGDHVHRTGYSRSATRTAESIEDLRSGNSGAEPRAQAEIGRAEGRVNCRYAVGALHRSQPCTASTRTFHRAYCCNQLLFRGLAQLLQHCLALARRGTVCGGFLPHELQGTLAAQAAGAATAGFVFTQAALRVGADAGVELPLAGAQHVDPPLQGLCVCHVLIQKIRKTKGKSATCTIMQPGCHWQWEANLWLNAGPQPPNSTAAGGQDHGMYKIQTFNQISDK